MLLDGPKLPCWLRALAATTAMALGLVASSRGQEPARPGGTEPGQLEQGQLLFNNACRTCHTTRDGDNRLGPHLHNIIGRKAGSLPNYGYSAAMKDADFVWNEENLERFIAKPDEVVPGNNMKPYGGLASAENRARIVSFLRSVSSGQ